jgi:hypothetical protein
MEEQAKQVKKRARVRKKSNNRQKKQSHDSLSLSPLSPESSEGVVC